MKLNALRQLLTFALFIWPGLAQGGHAGEWIPCTVDAVDRAVITAVSCAEGATLVRRGRLTGIAPVVGTEFYLRRAGRDCLIPVSREDQDRERFIRQPINVDCGED